MVEGRHVEQLSSVPVSNRGEHLEVDNDDNRDNMVDRDDIEDLNVNMGVRMTFRTLRLRWGWE